MTPTAIEAAARRIEGFVRETPLLGSPALDTTAGRRALVKAECLQHTGSFKYRGAKSAITALMEGSPPAGILAYSSGNHAQGVARAAAEAGLPAVIVMPAHAPRLKIEATRSYGAEVVPFDRYGESREAIGEGIAAERGLALVRPYDDAQVIAGQATVGLEIARQARTAGIERAEVLVPCSGGGLGSGIALALAETAPGFRVRTVEPEGFDDMRLSLAAGVRLTHPASPPSLCDALMAPMPGELTFPILARLAGPGLAVSDAECLAAMALAFRTLKICLEPGGAAALAAALFHGDELATETVIAVASGGNVDAATFCRALAME